MRPPRTGEFAFETVIESHLLSSPPLNPTSRGRSGTTPAAPTPSPQK
jgi:hypothetical protein